MNYKNPLYICYDAKQKKFLINEGLKYYVCGLNPNNHKTFWVFMRDKDLDLALNKWNKKIINKSWVLYDMEISIQ